MTDTEQQEYEEQERISTDPKVKRSIKISSRKRPQTWLWQWVQEFREADVVFQTTRQTKQRSGQYAQDMTEYLVLDLEKAGVRSYQESQLMGLWRRPWKYTAYGN